MKTMFLILGTFGSREQALLKTWLFLISCRRFGNEPQIYGTDLTYWPGYRAQKVDHALDYLEKNAKDFTHVFYTDACDALMLGSLQEIESKYASYGWPSILVSGANQLGNVGDSRYDGVFDTSVGPFCYPNVGGYFAEIPAMIETFRRFLKEYAHHGDDCFMWYDAYRDGWFKPVIDSKCEIWQVNATEYTVMDASKTRVINTVTGGWPAILHLSGGYSDPEYVRDERMLPWAYDLGIVPPGTTRDKMFPGGKVSK